MERWKKEEAGGGGESSIEVEERLVTVGIISLISSFNMTSPSLRTEAEAS
jgi:hypothetical protein